LGHSNFQKFGSAAAVLAIRAKIAARRNMGRLRFTVALM
jgi:hypothetical protein